MSTPDPTDQQAFDAARDQVDAARDELQGALADMQAVLAATEDEQ